MDNKIKALAQFLELQEDEYDDIKEDNRQSHVYTYGKKEYIVADEDEAYDIAKEFIEETLFAFRAEFILQHNNCSDDMSDWEYKNAIKAIEYVQGNLAEGVNGLIRCLISDIDDFVQDAIDADGKGHFIATYDGDENEETVDGETFYIYRMS